MSIKDKDSGWKGDDSQSCQIAKNTRSNSRQWFSMGLIFVMVFGGLTYVGYWMSDFEQNISAERAVELGITDITGGIQTIGTYLMWICLIATVAFALLAAFHGSDWLKATSDVKYYWEK